MPEAIGKGIASYISVIKVDATEPAKKELDQPISRREARNTKSGKFLLVRKQCTAKKESKGHPKKNY